MPHGDGSVGSGVSVRECGARVRCGVRGVRRVGAPTHLPAGSYDDATHQ
ncbi:hypothetical protein SSCG_02902 [Streptomyces clavuligerus]|nr:hypothetical protein SSCG_02902 [Streptomyces clavuligerus]